MNTNHYNNYPEPIPWEEWRDVKDFPWYQVSSMGSIISNKANKKWALLNWELNRGYHRVILSNNAVLSKHLVHRLVAQAFIPNPDNKPHINHKNGHRTDNRITNLEWCTPRENVVHGYKVLGRKPVKGNIPTNRRKVGRYTENGVLTKTYDYIRQTEQDGFRATTVSHCLAGKVKLHKWFTFKYI